MSRAVEYISEALTSSDSVSFEVVDPDISHGSYSGSRLVIDRQSYIYHPLKAWVNLAELLHCRISVPTKTSANSINITYHKLDDSSSFHTDSTADITEKYGATSVFASIQKLEEPNFLLPYIASLGAVKIDSRRAILNLGINSGDEFVALSDMLDSDIVDEMSFVGVDHSSSALTEAELKLEHLNCTLYCHDINDIDTLQIPKQDLIISVGTLQSPAIETKPLIMSLVQNYLTPNGAMILVFPNSRWIDGELIYGAKAPNYSYSELSLVIKDIYWIKKYLQQHKFRVTITGREYLFLTATKIGSLTRNM